MITLDLARPCTDPRCPICCATPTTAPVVVADGKDVARWLRAALATAMGKPV